MQHILIEPHYLGSLEYFTVLAQSSQVTLEVDEHFTKQTYKNRCVVLSANGPVSLSVPVSYSNRTPFRDVTIDHSQGWGRVHWGAFYSAYGKAPFFEFLASHFEAVWAKKHRFLLDLNLEMMTLCLKILQIDRPFQTTTSYQKKPDNHLIDLRGHIVPKIPFQSRQYYKPCPYTQIFGNNFVPNLSIIDLLMSEGGNALEVLRKSSCIQSEQI